MPAAALALGIVGLCFSLLPVVGYAAGVPISLIALGLGVLGRREAQSSGRSPSPAARMGLYVGAAGTVLGVANWAAWRFWLHP